MIGRGTQLFGEVNAVSHSTYTLTQLLIVSCSVSGNPSPKQRTCEKLKSLLDGNEMSGMQRVCLMSAIHSDF